MSESERNFAVGTVTFELDMMLHDSGSGREKHVDIIEQASFLVESLASFMEANFQHDDAQVLELRLLDEEGTGTKPVLTRELKRRVT